MYIPQYYHSGWGVLGAYMHVCILLCQALCDLTSFVNLFRKYLANVSCVALYEAAGNTMVI